MATSVRSEPRSGQGFTLLEVLLTILLLVAGIAAGLQANVMGLRLAAQTHTALLVVKGVQEYYLEYVRSLNFDYIGGGGPLDGSGPPTFQTGGPWTIPSSSGAPAFADLPPGSSGQYWVRGIDDPTTPNLKQVTVQVSWKDPSGHDQSSTLSTEISR